MWIGFGFYVVLCSINKLLQQELHIFQKYITIPNFRTLCRYQQ